MAHPDYLIRQLTATQLAEWEAYDKIEPIGQYRTDIMLGTLCSLIKDSLSSIFKKRGANIRPTHPWTWVYWMESEYKRWREYRNEDGDAVAIVKQAFGMT